MRNTERRGRSRLRLVTLIVAALSVGCGTSEPETVEAAAGPASAPPRSDEVILDALAQREAGVVVEEVRPGSQPEVLRAAGRITINENRTWRIGAVTDGRIVEVLVNEGDRVEQGQTLARMFSHDTHEARAEYQTAAGELDRLRAALGYAQCIRDRTRRLYQLKAASLQQLEQAEAELRNAETAVAHGKVELERTRVHLEDFLKIPAEVPEDRKPGPAGGDYDLIPIWSPGSGTLLHRNVTAGTVVEPSGELFVVADLSGLWAVAAVTEEHLSKLRVGMPVRVFVPAYRDRPFRGRLAKLGEQLDPATSTIAARIDVPNRSGLLKPEMRATAEFELDASRPGLAGR